MERIAVFLRLVHPRKTAEGVSAETGISAKTVATWLDGSSCPGGVAFALLVCAYGPDFLNTVLPNPPPWLAKAKDLERIAALEAGIEAQRRELERLR